MCDKYKVLARELIEPNAKFQKEEHCALLKKIWPNGDKQHLFFKNSRHNTSVAEWNRISLHKHD
jgi:hypothetical protein